MLRYAIGLTSRNNRCPDGEPDVEEEVEDGDVQSSGSERFRLRVMMGRGGRVVGTSPEQGGWRIRKAVMVVSREKGYSQFGSFS